MIDTTSLRRIILEMALTGKLSNHEGIFENSKTLLENVKAKNDVDKGSKKKFSEKDVWIYDRFSEEIPSQWTCAYLFELVEKPIKRGKAPVYVDKSSVQVFAQKCNLKSGGINMHLAQYLAPKKIESFSREDYLQDGDIVINSTGTGTLGRVGFFTDKDRIADMPVFPDSHITIVRISSVLEKKFFYYCIKLCQKYLEKSGVGSTNQKELKAETVMGIRVPLPSIQEQKIIVKKIDDAYSILDNIDVLQAQYTDNGLALRKKLLDCAIQGKLVEQRFEEGTGEELYQQIQKEKEKLIKEGKIKKQKPLPEITEDEKPFETPQSWKWVYLGDVFDHNTGKALNGSDDNGVSLTYITTSNLYWDHFELNHLKTMPFTDDEITKCTVHQGDLLVCEGGDIGRSAIWNFDYDMRIQNHIHRLRPYVNIDVRYFYYVMMYLKNNGSIRGRGIGLQGLSSKALHVIRVPLPPLAEQKRIVAKLEELLPLCDQLK